MSADGDSKLDRTCEGGGVLDMPAYVPRAEEPETTTLHENLGQCR